MAGTDQLYLTNIEAKRITLAGAGKGRDDLGHDVSPAVWLAPANREVVASGNDIPMVSVSCCRLVQ